MNQKITLMGRMILSLLVVLSLPARAASGLYLKTPAAPAAVVLEFTTGDTLDSRATSYALQGLVNQSSAEVFIDERGNDRAQLNFSGKPYTVLNVNLVGGSTALRGARTLFARYHTSVQKMFIYDPAKDWTFYLAAMAGAQQNGIPVTTTVRDALRAQVPGWAGTEVDYSNIGTTRVEGYDWALANLMPNCTKQSVYFARAFDLDCMDYVVASKSFVFNLLTTDPAQEAKINQIFATPGYGVGTSLGGYAGDSVNRLANPFGIGYNVSDFYSNGSFWSSFPNKTYTQPAGEAITAQNGKVYVAIVLSDGDNLQFDQGATYSNWQDVNRGTVPVGTSLSPVLQEIDTPLLDWYYANKTPNDELIAGPCGVQFIYLDDYNPDLLPAWCELSAKWTAGAGFTTSSMWIGTFPSSNYEVYTAMSGVSNVRHNSNLFPISENPKFSNSIPIFNERIRDCQNEQELYEDLAGLSANPNAPVFATGKLITARWPYTNTEGTRVLIFTSIKTVFDRLNADFPGKYVFQLPSDQAETARERFQPRRTWNTGSGTWDTTNTNWLRRVNGASVADSYTNSVDAVFFGDVAGVTADPTITLNSTVSPKHVTIKSTSRNYTLSGTGAIGGSTPLTLDPANTRTLTLLNPNTYTGDTNINGGSLTLGAGGRLGNGNYAGDIRIASGTFLNFATSSTQTLSGAITGGGTLNRNSGSDLILTGSAGNTINNLNVANGRIFIGNAMAITSKTAAVIGANGSLNFTSAPTTSGPIAIQNNGGIATRATAGATLGNVTLPGLGTVFFNNDDATTRALIITNDQTLTGTVTVQVGGNRMTSTTAALGNVTFSGVISGAGGLTMTSSGNVANTALFGTGQLILTGANTFTGDTTVTSGTLTLSGGGSISNTATIVVRSGATLDVSAPTTALTLGSGQTLKSSATGANATSTVRVASGKNLSLGDAALGLEFTAFGGGATAPLTLAGTAGSLNLNGRSIKVTTTSLLSGGPYKLIAKSGGATVTGTPGMLVVGGSGIAASGTLSVISGELFLTLAAPATYTITNTTTDVNGTCTPTGITTVAGGGSQTYTLTPNPDYAVATLVVNGAPVTPALSYEFNNVSANQTISATFVNIATLHWDSDGVTPGFGNTTGTWGTTPFWSVDASGSSAPFPITTATNTAVNFGSATLNYNNPAVTVAAAGVNAGSITFGAGQATPLTLSGGAITLGASAVITVNNPSSTIESVLAGAGTSLTKAGSGILKLTATHNYSGVTTIANGVLQLGAGNVIPDGPGTGNVAVAATLDLNTFSETINGLSGAGTVDTLAGGTPSLTVGNANATSTFSGTITNTTGTLTLVKTGTGTLTLAGANSYTGLTSINEGTLTLSGAGTLGSTSAGIALNGGQLDLGGLARTKGPISITAPAASGDTIRNGTLTGSSYTASNPSGNAVISAALAGTSGFTKSGDGTVTLSGANSFTGTTTLGAGTLAITNSSSLIGGLTFGATAGSATVSALDLSNGNAAYGGTFTVQTNTSANNLIAIGPGRTLATNGNVAIGTDGAVGIVTNLTVSGNGAWTITNSAPSGSFQIGTAIGSSNTNPASLDMSGLGTFNANLAGASSVFRLGDTGNASSTPVGSLKLAVNSTLTTSTLGVSDNSGSGSMRTLSLGTGVTTINANLILIGEAANQRGSGTIDFQDPVNGTLIIRSKTGATSTADLTLVSTGNSGGSHQTGRLLMAGHSVNVSLDAVVMASRSNGTGPATGEITFDNGTFSANSIAMTGRGGSSASGTTTGTITIGGGTANLGAVTMAVNTNANVNTGLATANLTLNGGSVTATSISMANAGSTGSVKTATGNLNLNGGSLTLTTGNITRTGTGGGTENAIITLNGGTLNMNNRSIGTGTAAVSLVAQAGTLQNVASINGLGGGLTKTTPGTLVLAGANTYTGATTVGEGTLALGATTALPNGSPVSIGNATLNATTAGIEDAGTLAVTAAATINLTAGARIEFDPSNGILWPGTLNLTGTFVPGVSLKFGNSGGGLDPTQLGKISATGFTGFGLTPSGYLTAIPDGFASWITGTFINGQVPPDKRGPHDDSDNDGISNLIEYAIAGQDPTVASPTIGTFTGTTLSFAKRLDATGLTYAIQDSTDLGATDGWAEVTGAPPTYVNAGTSISYTLTPGTPAKNFLRLQVLSN